MICLDTCALLWWTLAPDKLSDKAIDILAKADLDSEITISSIVLWEISIKCQKGKLEIGMSPKEYVKKLKSSGIVRILNVSELHWIEAVELDWAHKDHVDRVLVAASLDKDALLLTSDRAILAYYKKAINSLAD
jgi:PIN domain nuclease of toxin-antitoxin system